MLIALVFGKPNLMRSFPESLLPIIILLSYKILLKTGVKMDNPGIFEESNRIINLTANKKARMSSSFLYILFKNYTIEKARRKATAKPFAVEA